MNKKLWIAVAIAAVYVIGAIVMMYLNPTGLLFSVISFAIGAVGGYLLKSGLFARLKK